VSEIAPHSAAAPSASAPSASAPSHAADPSAFSRDGDYVRVPEEVALRHPLYGISGWLVVLAVLMILDATMSGLGALASMFMSGRLPNGGLVFFIGLVQAGFCIWMIACIVSLFRKNPAFLSQMTAICIVSLIFVALAVALAGLSWTLGIQAAMIVVYLAYVRIARRVRVTYRHEVEAADPMLQEMFSAGLPEHLGAASAFPRRIEHPANPHRGFQPARHGY
jgi:hypothetical protein